MDEFSDTNDAMDDAEEGEAVAGLPAPPPSTVQPTLPRHVFVVPAWVDPGIFYNPQPTDRRTGMTPDPTRDTAAKLCIEVATTYGLERVSYAWALKATLRDAEQVVDRAYRMRKKAEGKTKRKADPRPTLKAKPLSPSLRSLVHALRARRQIDPLQELESIEVLAHPYAN